MKRIGVLLALLLSVSVASAGPITVAPYQTWTMGTPTFWNNTSYDRNGFANIGVWISGTPGSDIPGFYTGSPGAFLPFLENSTFFWDVENGIVLKHHQSVTGWNDIFGLYNLGTGEKYPFFQAWVTKGQTSLLSASGEFGFYLTSGEGHTWYSNTLDGGRSHFALFAGENKWFLGVEDGTYTTARTADWDYNDVIIEVGNYSVPDSGSTLLLLGMGLGVLAFAWRR